MFIIAKRNFLIQISGREPYRIKKDYIGEIPEDVAAHWLVRAAIADGTIATPQGGKDKALEQADREAAEKEAESDIRPDAAQPDSSEPVEDSGKEKKSAKNKAE